MKKIIIYVILTALVSGLAWGLELHAVKNAYEKQIEDLKTSYEDKISRIESAYNDEIIEVENELNELETQVWNYKNDLPYEIRINHDGSTYTWECDKRGFFESETSTKTTFLTNMKY